MWNGRMPRESDQRKRGAQKQTHILTNLIFDRKKCRLAFQRCWIIPAALLGSVLVTTLGSPPTKWYLWIWHLTWMGKLLQSYLESLQGSLLCSGLRVGFWSWGMLVGTQLKLSVPKVCVPGVWSPPLSGEAHLLPKRLLCADQALLCQDCDQPEVALMSKSDRWGFKAGLVLLLPVG